MSSHAAALRLVDVRRLRAITLAARRDAESGGHSLETDPDIVALTRDPYESLADARDRLDRLEERLRHRNDRRAVFLTIYTNMTRAVQDAIEGGAFTDPAWMRDYTVTFANYYREAFLAFERGRYQTVPEPWRIAFATAVAERALVVQDAVLGINAHINYDLALAIRDVGVEPNRASKRDDHRTVNDILARLVDAQQEALAELYAPAVDDVDAALHRVDETVSLFTMTEAREQAWRVGVVLAETDWWPVTAYARWVLRTSATGGALFALAPSFDPELVRILERVERDRFGHGDGLELLKSRLQAVAAR